MRLMARNSVTVIAIPEGKLTIKHQDFPNPFLNLKELEFDTPLADCRCPVGAYSIFNPTPDANSTQNPVTPLHRITQPDSPTRPNPYPVDKFPPVAAADRLTSQA